MAKHTPGPWNYHKQPHPNSEHADLVGFAIYGDGATVADIFPQPYAVHVNEDNARLISASPDLLEACKAILPEIEAMADQIICPKDNGMRRHANRLRAAIAKAEDQHP